MPVQQEIVHWYNHVPDIANGDIPDDYPATPNYYPATCIIELVDLINRLCESEGNLTWEIRDGFVNIVSNNPSRGTYSFRLSQWRDNEREVKRYLRDWFPSFNIPYTMGGLASYIQNPEPIQTRILDEARRRFDNVEHQRCYEYTRIIPIEPHPQNDFNNRIRETLINVAIGLDVHLHYAITDTHVRIEDRGFDPVYTLSFRIDFFEMQALPIVEVSRRIRIGREVRRNAASPYVFESSRRYNDMVFNRMDTPNSVTRAIESKDTPSTCTGKEEASDVNYLDVI